MKYIFMYIDRGINVYITYSYNFPCIVMCLIMREVYAHAIPTNILLRDYTVAKFIPTRG
jgi:hypothetical protein